MTDRQILARQMGSLVTLEGNIVTKEGRRVKRNEEIALRLVKSSTNVPVPEVFEASYGEKHGKKTGKIKMSWIDGGILDEWWDHFDDEVKERICHHTWELIYRFRDIPKPEELESHFQVNADGTASHDVLIDPLPDHEQGPLRNDEDLRQRIYERYLHFNGRRYEKELPDMLPRAQKIVFTHADIAPRNIMIADNREYPVLRIVDWESAGWYPDYWEYANLMKPSSDLDWRAWMTKTAPEQWDISGVAAARRVLF